VHDAVNAPRDEQPEEAIEDIRREEEESNRSASLCYASPFTHCADGHERVAPLPTEQPPEGLCTDQKGTSNYPLSLGRARLTSNHLSPVRFGPVLPGSAIGSEQRCQAAVSWRSSNERSSEQLVGRDLVMGPLPNCNGTIDIWKYPDGL
jgi:hypothetical protein